MPNGWSRAARRAAFCILVAGVLAAHAAAAETGAVANIVASGSGEVSIPPTRASFAIGITTDAATASQASADNARISKAVAEALAAAGVGREGFARSRPNVGPRWTYDEPTRRQKKTGYEASNTMTVETEQLERVGAYIDVALDAGATDVSDVSFSARNADEARRQVLAQAVERARVDATTMATAGGGTLGELVLLTTEPDEVRPGPHAATVMVAAQRVGNRTTTSVTPGEILVTASVVGRWTFVPAPRAR